MYLPAEMKATMFYIQKTTVLVYLRHILIL